MDLFVLVIFCLSLLVCILSGLPIAGALSLGLILFLLYGRTRGFSWGELGRMLKKGVSPVLNILITFLLIGMLTALWRAAGTIPVLVAYASPLIRPALFLPMAFWLNCLLSFLTGTSFGTASTMGVICAAMGNALHVSPVLTGGAVLSGAFFGDRCSPVSTSALLVATLTGTDIYRNIRSMVRTARLPFLVSSLLFLLLGVLMPHEGPILSGRDSFAAVNLHPLALVPALLILVLALWKVPIKRTMAGSILAALPLCLFLQDMSIPEVARTALLGYHPADPQLAALLSGGGIVSMLEVALIVLISSSYSDLFQETGLLEGPRRLLAAFSAKAGAYAGVLATSLVTGLLACSQTLTILLSHQLCQKENPDPERLALDLEDTAVVVSPLIPWSIAGAVPLSVIGAPRISILAAFYLILLPLSRLIADRKKGEVRV